MMFERFSKDADWLEKMGVTVDDPKAFDAAAAKMQRNQLLIFSRWCQVMLRFEKAMYENPDQDLNKLWWDLVEKYQLREAARRAATPRTTPARSTSVSAPVYYHNYMMGAAVRLAGPPHDRREGARRGRPGARRSTSATRASASS